MPVKKPFARNRPDSDRLALVSLDRPDLCVRAQFNPHEVAFKRNGGWSETPVRGEDAQLEHTGSRARTMSVELLFDCFEIPGATLTADLDALAEMVAVEDPTGMAEKRRPPVLALVNGPIENFRCVLESMAVKVTMFGPRMQPVRATVAIELKEIADPRKLEATPPFRARTDYLAWDKAEGPSPWDDEEARRAMEQRRRARASRR